MVILILILWQWPWLLGLGNMGPFWSILRQWRLWSPCQMEHGMWKLHKDLWEQIELWMLPVSRQPPLAASPLSPPSLLSHQMPGFTHPFLANPLVSIPFYSRLCFSFQFLYLSCTGYAHDQIPGTKDVVQFAECFSDMHEVLGSEVQGLSRLCREFESSLGYLRSCLKTNNQASKQTWIALFQFLTMWLVLSLSFKADLIISALSFSFLFKDYFDSS